MRRATRPTRALRAPRDPRRWAQGAPPPGSRDLRLLAVRESPEADAAWVHHMTDAGHVEPVRPLALGAGRAVAWPAAHATVRVPCPTPRRSSVVSCVCPHSRIAAVSLAEFVAVHIVLVKLSVAILTNQQFRVKYY